MATYAAEKFTLKDGREVTIRSVEPEDVELFLEFNDVVSRETTHTLQTPLKPQTYENSKERFQAAKDHEVEVRWGVFSFNGEREEIVGMIGCHTRWDHPWTRHIAAFGMMIRKAFWGQGLGKIMLEILEEHCRKVGFLKIEAQVRVVNDRGVALYQNCGYEIEGTRRCGAIIEGEERDEYYIAKFLDGRKLKAR